MRSRLHAYSRCSECGHVQLDPLPDARDCTRLYGREYFEAGENGGYVSYLADEKLHRLNSARRLRLIERFHPETGRLLDIGCAFGFFLDEARRKGWSVGGVEISPYAGRWAQRELRLEVRSAVDDWKRARPRPDVITMFQLLAHLPEPKRLCEAVRAQIKPGGLLAVETWDRGSLVARLSGSRWQQITPPSVVHLFDRESLRTLLESTGYEIRWMGKTPKTVSVGQIAGLLSHRHPKLERALSPFTERECARWSVRYSLGDLISCVAVAV